ncbi:hypothetical protein HBI52_224610 [Parastagonospora nodorum]|nr:hypothetical protein HBI28_041010 [Parastagonospora nodorum]KAH5490381.1 hypothetical protein HBI52_224610 [Parastagonospora nodorum]KAH5642661.1 hypothetical protein HBI22_054030 [Parastagonospora nodorum]KAH6386076.1 hypothetical protein HBI60_224530 [Parastagonospora nodorum]KAH6523452.1 hypothetical protein HBI07_211890 [Parastagonospora nodorum]
MREHMMITALSWFSAYTVQTLSLCALIVFVANKVWKHLRHPLREFPGPRLAAWTDIPYCYWLLGGRQPFVLLQLHEKYGPVVRIAPNELSFNTAASWKDIYGYRPGHRTFVKGEFYDGAAFVKSHATRSLINTKDPTEHGKMRRYLANAFSDKSLREQESLVAQEVDKLVEKLGEAGLAKDGTDLQRWLNMATFDITGSLSFGRSFDALQNDGRHPTVAFILRAILTLSFVDTVRRFPWLDTVARIAMPGRIKGLESDAKAHEDHAIEVVRERIDKPSNRPDILTRIIDKKDEAGISDIQIAAHAADLLTAGSDSTNTAMGTVFYYLLKRSDIMQRLQAEIRSSVESYNEITALSTNNLPFLIAVIREAMRIYPPVPLALPRIVPEGGDTIDGRFVPAGTGVSTHPFAACLDAKNFEDPWIFRPERWLGKSEQNVREASQPFSLGTRGCIGQNLAWIEMRTIVAKVIYAYDLKWLNPVMDWHRESQMHILWHKPQLMVRVVARQRT